MATDTPIAIIGGGLGGLGVANALKAFGIAAEVFEAAPVLGEIGASINIFPNAAKALEAIGFGDELRATGHPRPGIFTRNMQNGEMLEHVDLTKNPQWRTAGQYIFHRADLMEILASGLDPATLHLGHRLESVIEHNDSVELTFSNGVTRRASFVIGADGIRSVLRHALYGDDNPTYTGQMVWRSLLKGRDVPADCMAPNGFIQWLGPGRHLLAYYLRGGEIINIVTQEDTDQWVEEGWSTPGDPDEMRRSFPNPEPRLAKILNLVTECSKWGLFTRPLTENWGRGRIQLIGDAAHAMLPNAGQGACQAFEDAYVLARWLDATDDPIEAFREFRRIRIPRVHGVQRFSMAAGRFKHMRNTTQQRALIEGQRGSVSGDRSWIINFDPVANWDKDPTVPHIDIPAMDDG